MLIKALFILTLLIVFVPPVRRFLFYLLVGRQLIKEQRRQYEQNPPVREGKTRITSKPNRNAGTSTQGGDFVDYEEVN